MESVWWRTHEKVIEGVDFDAFGTPEQLRVRQKVIPALQEELGLSVSSQRWWHCTEKRLQFWRPRSNCFTSKREIFICD
jgi:hypothetical protein